MKTPALCYGICIFLLIVSITVAGCISNENSPSASISGTRAVPVTNTSAPVSMNPFAANSTSFINIDPIGNHTIDDVFFITGTTNLHPGENLSIDIYKSSYDPSGEGSFFKGTVLIHPSGENNVNVWSCNITPTLWTTFTKVYGPINDIKYFTPGEFVASVESNNISSFSDVFTISRESANETPTIIPPFITIDPIGNHTAGDVFFINGTTNLPVTDNVSLNLDTYCNEFRPHMKSEIDPEYISISNIPIVPGIAGINLWSFNATDSASQNFGKPNCTGWEQLSPTEYVCSPECHHWTIVSVYNDWYNFSDFYLYTASDPSP